MVSFHHRLIKIDSVFILFLLKMISNEVFEIEWGHGMFSEGKEYIVETRKGFYKGTYKKPEMAIPYVILYNVKKDDIKMAQVIFYREDTFYDSEDYIQKLKYKAQQAQQSMEKRALNEILRQLIDENYKIEL